MADITFKSASNKIEGIYYHNNDPDSQVVLILVGDKQNYNQHKKTIDGLVEVFVKNCFSVFRICFIRTLNKDNDEDENTNAEEQELFDATSALNWLHEKNPEAKGCWICGYGKGALASLQLVMRRPEIDNYMIISPDLNKNDLNFIVPCIASGILIKSVHDNNFTEDDILGLQEKLITKTESKVDIEILHTRNNDFSDNLQMFKDAINSYISEKFEEYLKNYSNSIKDRKRRRRKKRLNENSENKLLYCNPIKPLDLSGI